MDFFTQCLPFLLYEVKQKSNEADFLFTKVFIFFKHQCYPHQNSSLWQLHTDGDVAPISGSSAGSHWDGLQHVRYTLLDVF
jgi:hypothetical protein